MDHIVQRLILIVIVVGVVQCSALTNSCDGKQVAFSSGDLIIGGVMPVHVGKRLNKPGVMWVEAMIYVINEINRNGSFLPGINLGYDIRDSCASIDIALESVLDFILSPNVVPARQTKTGSCLCAHNETTGPPVIAVIGGAPSSISAAISPVLSTDNIAQISYSSTSPSLSDKSRYSSFLRTIPSDIHQAKVIADVLAHFKWTYVSVLVSDNEYGRNGLGALRNYLKLKGICVAVEAKFRPSHLRQDIVGIVEKLVLEEHSSVAVLWCDYTDAMEFLKLATGKLDNMTWIGTESWGDNNEVKNSVNYNTIKGMLGVLPFYGRYDRYEAYLRNLTVNSKAKNPWLAEYWAEQRAKCGNCSDDELPTAAQLPPNKYANVMDGVYAIAHGLQTLQVSSDYNLTLDKRLIPNLLAEIKKVEFNGRSGKGLFKFSDTGDPDYGAYIIKNLQSDGNTREFVQVAHYDGQRSRIVLEPGSRIQWTHGLHHAPLSRCSEYCGRGYSFVKSSRDCCWTCVRCLEDFVKNTLGNTECTKCPTGYTSNDDRTRCVKLEHDILWWHSTGAIVVVLFSFLGFVLVAFSLAVFRKYSETAVVKASNRELSNIHLICHGLVFLLPFSHLDTPHIGVCIIRSYCFAIFYTLITSITFLKTDRIVRIFNSKSRLTKRSRLLSNKVQLILTLLLISVPTIGTTVWVVMRPLAISTKRVGSTQIINCGTSDNELHLIQLAYIVFIALLCAYEAYNARRLPESFNEAKFICFGTFGFVLMWIGYIPACLDTVGSSKQFVTCLFILLTNFVSLTLIYAPKMNIILFHPEANRHETFRRSTLRTCMEMASRIPSSIDLNDSPRLRSNSLPAALQQTITPTALPAHKNLSSTDIPDGKNRKLPPIKQTKKLLLGSRSNTPSPKNRLSTSNDQAINSETRSSKC